MTITKLEAWTMFRAEKLGQIEGTNAIGALVEPDFLDYEEFANDFELKLAEIGIEAQNEAAAIMESNPMSASQMSAKPPYHYLAEDYIELVTLFSGSKFERLHLSAMFRVQNAELLLELVKP